MPHVGPEPRIDYADRIASLVERRLPLSVEGAGNEDDWNLVGPAMLAAATRHLRALEHLQANFPSGVVAWQLVRSVFEYVTTFAWIAADPEVRIRRWLKYDYGQRIKVDNDLGSLGGDRILDKATRARLTAYEPDLDQMPRFVDVAREADEAWAENFRLDAWSSSTPATASPTPSGRSPATRRSALRSGASFQSATRPLAPRNGSGSYARRPLGDSRGI